MKLYHGTCERVVPDMLINGVRPRGRNSGNWKHSVKSNPKAVYLTDAYALHFAGNATKKGERLAILEINSNKLNPFLFAPDEDFLEQVTREHPEYGNIFPGDMVKRTQWFRQRALSEFSHNWEKSMKGMGTCCYYGTIPPDAITRYAIMSPSNPVAFMSDPTVTPINYACLGHYYRQLMRHIFGDKIDTTSEEFFGSYMERLQKAPRDGIEVFNAS